MKNIKYYDTHAHINIEPLDIEVDSIINELKSNQTIINCIGVDIETSLSSIELSKKYKNTIFACVGIHPIDGLKYKGKENKTIEYLEKIIKENLNNIVCIGEIGLDYFHLNNDQEKKFQKHIFKKQIELAIKYNLPINIHNRNSSEDLLKILDEYNLDKVMIHCFSMDKIWAKKFIDKGYILSIPGIVTFKNAKDLHEAIKEIPINKIVAETDSPFLTPIPHRGQINKPHYVKYIVKEIAKIKGLNEIEVQQKLLDNSLQFFNINKFNTK